MSDVEVRGADAFLALSKALKAAGQTELRKELHRGLRQAGKPLIPRVRQRLVSDMPSRGGAGTFLAGKRARVAVKTGRDPGVSVVFAKQDPRLDDGRLAHPVFDRRRADGKRVYVVQRVRPGVFSGALADHGPEVRDELTGVLDQMLERVVQEVR